MRPVHAAGQHGVENKALVKGEGFFNGDFFQRSRD
jgi:hypothetical protein